MGRMYPMCGIVGRTKNCVDGSDSGTYVSYVWDFGKDIRINRIEVSDCGFFLCEIYDKT